MRLQSQKETERCSQARDGFTLTELLVVIAIIAILSALGSWGVFAMISSRQKSNTELTIRVVDKLLQNRWAAVIADAKKETPSIEVMNLAGGDAERARVIWVKARLVEAFPMTYKDCSTDPNTVVNKYILPASRRKTHFNKYQQSLGSLTGGAAGESSACLLAALMTLQADATSIDDQIKYAIAPTDGTNKVNILVDSFGLPLLFQRFTTGGPIQAVNPAAPGSRNFKFADPTDPDGKLLTSGWYNNVPPVLPMPLRTKYESDFLHTISLNSGVNAAYVLPVITSAGKDGNPATTGDNIYNFMLRGD